MPFCFSKPIKISEGKNETRFEYKHYDLRCYKRNKINDSSRGLKTWQVLIEDELYNTIDQECISDYLYPMMICNLVGGRIVKVEKYNT